MRILALEIENRDATADYLQPLLEAEARKVWKLHQEDFIREIYFRADMASAVLMLECENLVEAQRKLSALPLVAAGLVEFEMIPLTPYPGFARLWSV